SISTASAVGLTVTDARLNDGSQAPRGLLPCTGSSAPSSIPGAERGCEAPWDDPSRPAPARLGQSEPTEGGGPGAARQRRRLPHRGWCGRAHLLATRLPPRNPLLRRLVTMRAPSGVPVSCTSRRVPGWNTSSMFRVALMLECGGRSSAFSRASWLATTSPPTESSPPPFWVRGGI